MPRRNSGQRQRQLVYGGRRPRVKQNVVAEVPVSLSGGLTAEERRRRLPLPEWASPAAAYRPTTQEFSQAAENISLINYQAFLRAKKTAGKDEYSWQHYVSTEPRKSRKLIAFKRAPRLPPQKNNSGLELRETWLEPIVDEKDADAEFEQRTRNDGPKVRLLKRVLRRKQKEHDAISVKYKSKIAGFKPQRWISRADPKVKIEKVHDWLKRHNLQGVADAVKVETKEAIMGAGRGKGNRFGTHDTKKHKERRRGRRRRNQKRNQFFAKRPVHWKPHPGDPTGDHLEAIAESPLLSRSTSLTVAHQKKWYGHKQKWQSQRASVDMLPPLLPPLTHAATISGGVRYLSPLLLPHEADPVGRSTRRRRGWQH